MPVIPSGGAPASVRIFPGTETPASPAAAPEAQDSREDGVDVGHSAVALPPSPLDTKVAPYIVIPPKGGRRLTREALQKLLSQNGLDGGAVFKEEIPLMGGMTATLDGRSSAFLREHGYRLISDETIKFILPHPNDKKRTSTHYDDEPSPQAVEVTQQRPPLTAPRYDSELTRQYPGKGVNIAFLDTGIYPHPDFNWPNNRIVAFKDFVNGRSVPYDDNGHGTHVAGDAAGNGHMSEGVFRGPAPEAGIIGVKVLNNKGGGRTSDILQGINWCIENKERYNIRVMNMSLGNRASIDPKDDPIYQAVDRAIEAGIVVVAAAGNEGPEPNTINTPGDNPNVITVGAYDDFNTADASDDRIPDFSSRGPTYDKVPKPDLVAPGEAIIGPNAPTTPTEEQARKYEQINQTLQWMRGLDDGALQHMPDDTLRLIGLTDETMERVKSSPEMARREIERLILATDRTPLIDTSYVGTPGTSVATPIVSGVVAEMLQANPNLTPAQVKQILRTTAIPLARYSVNTQGAGALNPQAAIEMAARTGPSGLQMTLDDLASGALS
jgi:subtilisin family serine protease